jgi:hypothetical protein
VAIKNTDQMMGKRTGVAYPGTIEIVLLPPISVESEASATKISDLLEKTRRAIAEELAKPTNTQIEDNG